MGKKPIVSVTFENEWISIKNSLSYLKCVLRLSCVVHGLIYGRFMGFLACVQTSPLPPASFGRGDVCTQAMGFYVNGFLSI